MQVGTWDAMTGRVSFSDGDLDEIQRSFDLLGLAGRVPLKFGHNDDQPLTDGQPALGWVGRLYREGKKLLGDFTDLPQVVYDLIKAGRYKFLSVELLGNVKAGSRVIPWVLDAVALLGADQPAIGTLKDLQSLTMARGSGLQSSVRVALTRATPNGGHKPNMADEPNKDVAALLKRLDDQDKQIEALKMSAARAESAETKLTELQTATRNEKITAHRAKVLEMFESAIKDKKVLPAARERFKRVYKVETDAVLEIPLTDVETFIRENPNPDAPRNLQSVASGGVEAPVDALADTQALCAARKVLRENAAEFSNMPRWEQLQRAGIQAFRANPELGKAYQRLPETLATRAE
jgi:hypothetical protein